MGEAERMQPDDLRAVARLAVRHAGPVRIMVQPQLHAEILSADGGSLIQIFPPDRALTSDRPIVLAFASCVSRIPSGTGSGAPVARNPVQQYTGVTSKPPGFLSNTVQLLDDPFIPS